MYFVYVIQSEKDQGFYTGHTSDLENRIVEHNKGNVESTRRRRPFRLVYYEASRNVMDAIHREKYLKSTYGKRYIRNRIKNDLEHH